MGQQWTSIISLSRVFTGRPANTRLLSNADLMLGQRRRRWANIKSPLFRRFVFFWEDVPHNSLIELHVSWSEKHWISQQTWNTVQWWFNVGPASQTVYQHWNNNGTMFLVRGISSKRTHWPNIVPTLAWHNHDNMITTSMEMFHSNYLQTLSIRY